MKTAVTVNAGPCPQFDAYLSFNMIRYPKWQLIDGAVLLDSLQNWPS